MIKNIKSILVTMGLVFTMVSCGNDDNENTDNCTSADWVGTYSGMCDSGMIVLAIFDNGSNGLRLSISVIEGEAVEGTSGDLELNDCNATVTNLSGVITLSLDGNAINVTIPEEDGTFSECNNQSLVTKD